jgi:hypothetical protein
MFRRIRQFAAWVTELIVVFLLIDALTFSLAWAGSGAGTGIFSYWFRARFRVDQGLENGHTIYGSVNVEGRVEPRFKVWGHMSPRYHEVQIDWQLFGDKGSEGQAVVDLDQMLLHHDGHTVLLTADSLGSLVGLSNSNDNNNAIVTGLIQFFQSAREGTLPLPNHHGHSLPEPLPGRMQHFAMGPAIRPLGLFWVFAWSIVGLSRSFTRQRILVGETEQA